MRTGLPNLLMDAHASATAKADPEGYVTKSRELAEKKLASLYAGIIGVQSVGGVAKPTDPVSAVVMRLARRTIQKEKASDIAAAPKDQRLALINRLAAEYAQSHDVALRPRAEKIVALENVEAEPLPVKKAEPVPTKKARRLPDFQTCNNGVGLPAPFLFGRGVPRGAAIRAAGSWCPTLLRSHGRPFVGHRDGFISKPGSTARSRGS